MKPVLIRKEMVQKNGLSKKEDYLNLNIKKLEQKLKLPIGMDLHQEKKDIMKSKKLVLLSLLTIILVGCGNEKNNLQKEILSDIRSKCVSVDICEISPQILFNTDEFDKIVVFQEGGKNINKELGINTNIDYPGAYRIWVLLKNNQLYKYYLDRYDSEKPYLLGIDEYNSNHCFIINKGDRVFGKKQIVDGKEYFSIKK